MVNTTTSPTSESWLQEFQSGAATRFSELDWPKRTDEHWRFADIKRAPLDGFEPEGDRPSIQTPDGVQILSLQEMPADRLEHLLTRNPSRLGSSKYLALAHSKLVSGTCVIVPEGMQVEEPVIITHRTSGALAPITLVVAEPNSKVSVFERLQSENEAVSTVVGTTGLLAETGAQASYCLSQELSKSSRHVHATQGAIGRDATLQISTANFGADWIRQECLVEMHFQGGNCEALGLNLAGASQQIDQRTLQHHFAGQTRSDLLYKNALFDESRAIFSGLIQVDEGAHYTDAFQTCRNLLLSERAESNAMPGLEINADQVKCSHGATSSQIDPEELFYLAARGIPEAKARLLVTLGFANEVIQRIHNPGIQEVLTGLLEERLNSLGESSVSQ